MHHLFDTSKRAAMTLVFALGLMLGAPAWAKPSNEEGITLKGESFSYYGKKTKRQALPEDDTSFGFVFLSVDPNERSRYSVSSSRFAFNYDLEVHNHRSDPVRVKAVEFEIVDLADQVVLSRAVKFDDSRHIMPKSPSSLTLFHLGEALYLDDGTPLVIRITDVQLDPPLDYAALANAALFLSSLTRESLDASADLEADFEAFAHLPGMPTLTEFSRMWDRDLIDVFSNLLNLIPASYTAGDAAIKQAMDNYFSGKFLIEPSSLWELRIFNATAADKFIQMRQAHEAEKQEIKDVEFLITHHQENLLSRSVLDDEVEYLDEVKSAVANALKAYSKVSKESPNYAPKRIGELKQELTRIDQKISQVEAKRKKNAQEAKALEAKRDRDFRRQCSQDQLRILDQNGRPSSVTTSVTSRGKLTTWWYGRSVMYQFANGKLVHTLRPGN